MLDTEDWGLGSCPEGSEYLTQPSQTVILLENPVKYLYSLKVANFDNVLYKQIILTNNIDELRVKIKYS